MYDKAVVPIEKLTKYALSMDEDKAAAFKQALGYTVDDAEALASEILSGLRLFPAEEKPDLGHGKRCQVIMTIDGVNGKSANVLTGWIEDAQTGGMRLTTAFVTKKKPKGRLRDDCD